MSFRGAKRRGNPLKRNENTVAIAIDLACFRNHYRAENLCYQFEQGQKLLPQFRKIVCLVGAPSAQAEKQNTHSGRSYTRNVHIQGASRNGIESDMHEFVRDIVAYGNSDICAFRK